MTGLLDQLASHAHARYAIVFGSALAASLALTPLVRWLAHREGWLDHPDGGRKQHPVAIPRIGGLAVYFAFFLSLWLALVSLPGAAGDHVGVAAAVTHVFVASTLVMLVGLVDDIRGVRPAGKLGIQLIGAVYLYLNGYQVSRVSNPLGDPVELGLFALPVTVLWFVGMSNAFNLIDGLDGLAAGVGLFATGTLLVSAAVNGRGTMVVVLCALAGALLGFLRFNYTPATIFLGDSGALFVGFALAAFAISSSIKASAAVAVGVPLFALALPILDVVLSVLRRFAKGAGLFEADHEHIHHRLLRKGLTPRRAVIWLYGVAAVGASLSFATMTAHKQAFWAIVLTAGLLVWAGVRELGYVEFGEFGKVVMRRFLPERVAVANNTLLLHLPDDFQRAKCLAEMWDLLVDTTARLGFHRLQLAVNGTDPKFWATAFSETPSRHSFPVWHEDPVSDPTCEAWSWTVVLNSGHEPFAELTVTRRASGEQLRFEPSYLIAVLTREFAACLTRFLPCAPVVSSVHVQPTAPPLLQDRLSRAR